MAELKIDLTQDTLGQAWQIASYGGAFRAERQSQIAGVLAQNMPAIDNTSESVSDWGQQLLGVFQQRSIPVTSVSVRREGYDPVRVQASFSQDTPPELHSGRGTSLPGRHAA